MAGCSTSVASASVVVVAVVVVVVVVVDDDAAAGFTLLSLPSSPRPAGDAHETPCWRHNTQNKSHNKNELPCDDKLLHRQEK